MKRLIFILSIMILCLTFPVFAQNNSGQSIIDNAGILGSAEKTMLAGLAASVSLSHKFDLFIVTEKNIGDKSTEQYAEDFFKSGYGKNSGENNCLLLIVKDTRDYWISAFGSGRQILDSYAGSKLDADVQKNLSNNNYNEACRTFITNWDEFLTLKAKGRNYNILHQYQIGFIAGAWILSFLIGLLIVLMWKKGMNTALAQTHAAAYIIPDSLIFKEKKDRFLYSTVTKVKRETTSSSGSGGGVRKSSSGRSGRGGKF